MTAPDALTVLKRLFQQIDDWEITHIEGVLEYIRPEIARLEREQAEAPPMPGPVTVPICFHFNVTHTTAGSWCDNCNARIYPMNGRIR